MLGTNKIARFEQRFGCWTERIRSIVESGSIVLASLGDGFKILFRSSLKAWPQDLQSAKTKETPGNTVEAITEKYVIFNFMQSMTPVSAVHIRALTLHFASQNIPVVDKAGMNDSTVDQATKQSSLVAHVLIPHTSTIHCNSIANYRKAGRCGIDFTGNLHGIHELLRVCPARSPSYQGAFGKGA